MARSRGVTGGVLQPWYSRLNAGIVWLWNLDEASGTRYDTWDGAYLTAYNNPGSVAGMHGNAAQCLSASSQALIRSSMPAWPYPAITVSAWIRIDVLPGANKGVFVINPDFAQWGNMTTFALSTSMNKPRLFVGNGSAFFQAITAADTDTGWHLWVGWYDDIYDRKAYLQIDNGTVYESSPLTGTWARADNGVMSIARGTNQFIDITVDEMVVRKNILTSDERTELWNGGAGKFYPY